MATILRSPIYFRTERKRLVGEVTAQNLLLTTLAAAVVAAAPFKPADFQQAPRKPVAHSAQVLQDNLLLQLLAPPRQIGARPDFRVEPHPPAHGFVAPNLLLATLNPQQVAASVPESLAPQLRRWLPTETSQAPFAPRIPVVAGEAPFKPSWLETVFRPGAPSADTSLSWRYIPARAEPFFTQEWQGAPTRPAAYTNFEQGGVAEPDELRPTASLLGPISARPAVAAQGDILPLFFLPAAEAPAPPFTPLAHESVWRQHQVFDQRLGAFVPLLPAEILAAPFTPPAFEFAARQREVRDWPVGMPPQFIPPVPPFVLPDFVAVRSRPQATDWTPGATTLYFPEVVAPFAPVDVQRPQARPPVAFELPPNLQALLAIVPAAAPFKQLQWPSPIEWAIHYEGLRPDTWRIPTDAAPPLASGPGTRGILVTARQHELLVEARLHTILVESDGTV